MLLGKLAPRHDPRTLMFAKYASNLPAAPKAVDWTKKIQQIGMMKNDSVGDCTCAAAGHLIESWSANAGTEIVPTESEIIQAYSAISGYNPATGKNDNGAVCLDVLNFWRKTGIANDKISAYVALAPKNKSHVQDSIYLFGGVYIGLELPISAQNQATWTVTKGPNAQVGSWGGHCVCAVAFDDKTITVVTWGQLKKMTWQFWNKYCDEAYAVLSNDWFTAGKDPSGFDLGALSADLKLLAA